MMYLPIPSVSTRLYLWSLSLHFFLTLVARSRPFLLSAVMSGPSCEGNVDRYLSNDFETCNEVEIVSVEQRKKRRKARKEGRASSSDDVIVVGCSSAGKQPQKGTGTATTSSDCEDDNAGVVRVDPVQGSDMQSCSSAQATRGEIPFVEEVQTQTDKNDAPPGTTPQASGAAQDKARPREEGQQGHRRGKKKLLYSHKGRLHLPLVKRDTTVLDRVRQVHHRVYTDLPLCEGRSRSGIEPCDRALVRQ